MKLWSCIPAIRSNFSRFVSVKQNAFGVFRYLHTVFTFHQTIALKNVKLTCVASFDFPSKLGKMSERCAWQDCVFVTNSFSGIASPTLKLFVEYALLAGVLRPLASPDEGKIAWARSPSNPFSSVARTMNRSEYQRQYRQEYKAHAKRVNLTFSLPEYRLIARAAKARGLAVSAYVKRFALQTHHNDRHEAPEALAEQLADLDRVIRTIANNVNQMARHSNRIAHVLDEQEVFLHIHALQLELQATIARAATSKPTASRDASTDEDTRP